MDEFADERSELTGTLITLEFGPGGRITQFWAADPTTPEDGEEFQFVLGPVSFGEEFSEDYYPGTILVGARTTPDEPWIVSRNASAESVDDDEDPLSVKFEYDFPLLPELRATGRFYEVLGVAPQICWDVEIFNRGRVSIEIGELAFPFAFYNLMLGSARDEKSGRNPYQDRVNIHKFIGGSASYLHAQRMSAEAPGLLIFPGDGARWEMFAHVPRSLSSHYHWEGIPMVYVYSRASIDREGWNSAYSDHSSLILEPGDHKRFQTRFVPTSPAMGDVIFQTLTACQRPAMRVLPAAVAPAHVGIGLEIGGVAPTKFSSSREAAIETDLDDNGGFCFIRPKDPGPLRVWFDDKSGDRSEAQLFFTEPIETLIRKRAQWICENQFHEAPGTSLHSAILMANIQTQERITAPERYAAPFSLESGLSDALFLAEKNAIYPEQAQLDVLQRFLTEFLRDDLQNPADGSVGCVFADDRSVALNFGRLRVYPLVFNFYLSMYRIAKRFGALPLAPQAYLNEAARTAFAFFRIPTGAVAGGLPSYARLVDLIDALELEGSIELAEGLRGLAINRARDILRSPIQDQRDLSGDAGRFEELFWAARWLEDFSSADIALRYAFALRDLAPCWWSYGSDYRIFHELDGAPHEAIKDKGQLMLGHTTIPNSLMLLSLLETDSESVDDVWLRMAFGGLLGSWALVRSDGAASMGFCPDAASGHYGLNPLTGDLGAALFAYLRGIKSIVIPSRNFGVTTFGCHFEALEKEYLIQPWDGVNQRIALRQIGFDLSIDTGKLIEARLDIRKRSTRFTIENPSDFDTQGEATIRGLWGPRVQSDERVWEASEGLVRVPFQLKARQRREIAIEVTE